MNGSRSEAAVAGTLSDRFKHKGVESGFGVKYCMGRRSVGSVSKDAFASRWTGAMNNEVDSIRSIAITKLTERSIAFAPDDWDGPAIFFHGKNGELCDTDLEPSSSLIDLQQIKIVSAQRINGTFLRFTGSLRALERLDLIDGPVVNEALQFLRYHPQLKICCLNGAVIDQRGVKEFSAASRLRELTVFGSRVGECEFTVLQTLDELRQLTLASPSISGRTLRSLIVLRQLRQLTIQHSQIDESAARELRCSLSNCDVSFVAV